MRSAAIGGSGASPSLPAADTALSVPPLMVGVPWKLLACEKEEWPQCPGRARGRRPAASRPYRGSATDGWPYENPASG